MKILVFLTAVITTQAAVVKNDCDGITINNVYHDKELLLANVDLSDSLAVDYSTNNLYYSYSTGYNVEPALSRTAIINLNTKEISNFTDVINGDALALDQNTHDVYIGTFNGIYKVNHGNNNSELFGAKDRSILFLYLKDVLYYSTYDDFFLYTLVNGESSRFDGLGNTMVYSFVIDNDNDIFFSNNSGIYKHNIGTKTSLLYKAFLSDEGIRWLGTDINGKVYACLRDGMYVANKKHTSLDKLFNINDCFGFTFDNENNFVYFDLSGLYRLKPNKSKNC